MGWYQLQFYLGVLLALPLSPLLAYLGFKTKRSVVVLPEAKEPKGITTAEKDGAPFQLLLLGESTMAGVGVTYHRDGFAGAMANLLTQQLNRPVHWQVVAKNGLTAKGVRTELLPKIPVQRFDLILIGLGGNDTFELNTPMHWAQQNRLLIQELQQLQPTVPIVYIHLPPVGQFPAFPKLMQLFLGGLVRLHGKALDRLVGPLPGVWFCSEQIASLLLKGPAGSDFTAQELFSDGVHPSALTYRLWAGEVADYLRARPKTLEVFPG